LRGGPKVREQHFLAVRFLSNEKKIVTFFLKKGVSLFAAYQHHMCELVLLLIFLLPILTRGGPKVREPIFLDVRFLSNKKKVFFFIFLHV
jgi:hypothetical protein